MSRAHSQPKDGSLPPGGTARGAKRLALGVSGRRLLRLLAAPGVVAIGVLCVLPVFYLSAIRPAQDRLESLRSEVDVLRAGGGRLAADAPAPARELAELYRALPSVDTSPQWLGKVFAAAREQGLSLDHGEYRAVQEKAGRLVRLHVTLPVSGPYPRIRKFLGALSADVPALSLEHVQFERQEIGKPTVDAKITLVLHLVEAS